MLIGEYTHSLDDKNRVSLPARFREKMGKKMVVTAGLDNCLFIFTLKEWERISEKLAVSSLGQADNRGFGRYMFASASEAELGSIGRILIPEYLQKLAGLKGKVAVVGVQSRVELWNEKAWQAYKKGVAGKAGALAEKLGQVGII